MTKWFQNAWVRLAGRAAVVAVAAVIVQERVSNGTATWHALVVAGALAFAEVFTPLNPLVGAFKGKLKSRH